MPNTSLTRTYWLAMLAVVLVAAVGRALLLAGGSPSFHSDEAIVGLMARHILAGEPPTFFYGQAYMGSLDAWLVALGFRAFGESVATIRLVQALLYLGVVASAYAAAHALLRRLDAALIVGLLFAVGTPLLTLYTAATLGGYNETLLFGHLLIALTMGRARGLWRWALVGLIAGVGWWTNALIVVYILPLLVWGAWRVGRSAKEQGHSSFVGAQYIAPLQTDGLAHGAGLAPPTGTSSPLRAQSRQTPTDEAGLAAGGTTHGSSPTPSSPFASSPHPLSPHHLLSLSPQSSVLSTLLLLFLLGSAPWWLYALQNDLAPIRFFLPDVLGGRETVGAVIPSLPWDQRLIGLLLLGLPSAVGLRFPWAGDFFAPLVGLLVVACYATALWSMARAAWEKVRGAKEQDRLAGRVGAQYIAPLQKDIGLPDAGLARQTPTNDAGLAAGGTTHGSSPTSSSPFASSPHHRSPDSSLITQSSVLTFAMIGFLCALFLLTRFSSDPSGRYFVPLAFPLAVALAAWVVRLPRVAMLLVVALVLGYHAAGQVAAARSELGFTTQFVAQTHLPNRDDQALIDFMRARGLRNGYTTYWVSFRIAFLSGEAIQMSAALPDKSDLAYTTAFERYPPYRHATDASPQIAYVTANVPELDAALAAWFAEEGITYEVGQVGIYRVYYDFAPRVPRPEPVTRPSDP